MAALCFIIHGVGTQHQEYSEPLQTGVQRELTKLIREKKAGVDGQKWTMVEATGLVDFQPIYWADIGTAEQNNLFRKVYPQSSGTERWYAKVLQFVTRLAPVRKLSINLIGDVIGYLSSGSTGLDRKSAFVKC